MKKKSKKNGELLKKNNSETSNNKKVSFATSLKSIANKKKNGNVNVLKNEENKKSDKNQKNKSRSVYDSKSILNRNNQAKNKKNNKKSIISDFERGYIEGQKSCAHLRQPYGYVDVDPVDFETRFRKTRPTENSSINEHYYGRDYELINRQNRENQYGVNKREIAKFQAVNNRLKDVRNKENGDNKEDKKNTISILQNKSRQGFTTIQNEIENKIGFENRDRKNIQNQFNKSKFEELNQIENEEPQEYRIKRDYQNEGHQYFGETEGFGNRYGQQHGQDWIEQDEYREGHSQTKRGHGRYGSR